MGKIMFFTLLLISNYFYTQHKDSIIIGEKKIRKYDIIIEFDKTDSIKIEKGMKRNIYVYIYMEENIAYNKKNGFVMPTTHIYDPLYKECKECKTEMLFKMLEPIRKPKNKISISAKLWKRLDAFEVLYFKIGKKYYEYIGTAIE